MKIGGLIKYGVYAIGAIVISMLTKGSPQDVLVFAVLFEVTQLNSKE